jgi:hypothetical protein
MLYTVDCKLNIITLGGVPLTGFAEDQFDIERDEELFNDMVGCTGDTARSHINNKNGKCDLHFLQTSPSNDYLSALALRDYQTNTGVLPFMVVDALGTTRVMAPMAYVKNYAKIGAGKAVKNRDWVIRLVSMNIFVGGNIPTI